MKSRIMRAALLATIAAGCGPTGGPSQQGNEAAGSTADYQARLAAMPEGERNAVFIRALRDARRECQHVDSSESAGEYRGMPVWSAHCSGGGNWTIVIGENGVAQILNADETRLVDNGAAAANQQ